nr:G-type lectin S-receptor-like serine/threonine-protein kinase At4g27290 isoform X1 [Ipomoea batatas]
MNSFVLLSCLLVIVICLLNTPLIFSHGVETISGNKYITQATTISSPNGRFELGFFTPGQSSNYYIGIWYKNISPQTVVWVANRVTPIPSSAIKSSKLRILDRDLVLVDGAQNLVWSTNLSVTTVKQNSVLATLGDSGNLVLIDDGTPLWQSFDHPTDTFLPGAKFGYNKRTKTRYGFTSWKSWDDPAPGLFSIESDGHMTFQLWSGTEVFWKSGPKFGADKLKPNPAYNYTIVDNENETYFTYNLLHPSVICRNIIDVNGQDKTLVWSEVAKVWMGTYLRPPQECDVYAYCGPFGICNHNSTTVCVCLQGFKYKSEKEWKLNEFSGGCVRKIRFKCGSNYQEEDMDRFVMYPNVRLPRHPQNITADTQAECESTCLKNCSCTAYAYSNSRGHCWIWVGQLLNLKQLGEDDINGSTIHVRLAAPEFSNIKDKNSKQLLGKLKEIIASVAVATAALVACTIFYVCYKRRRAAFKITELAVDAMDEMIDEDTYDENGMGVPLITFQSILEATNNFSDANKQGEGGFGPVYKGMLFDGQEIAIKRLSSQSRQGINEFKNEVVLIAKLQHRNLVKLVGYCSQVGEKILLYEHMPNKSLDTFIFGSRNAMEVFHSNDAIGTLFVSLVSRELCESREMETNFFVVLSSLLLPISLLNTPLFSHGVETISGNKYITQATTISSPNGRFELGFFTPGQSSKYYIGIWYKNISPQTVVWVANRVTPIPSSAIKSSKLRILDGDLVLVDGAQNLVWSTNLNVTRVKQNSVLATLRDNGNLVLSDDGINSTTPLWESFDHPTDTNLPGSKFGYNKRTKTTYGFTSWKSWDDPAPGLYSLDNNGDMGFLLWNRIEEYGRSGHKFGIDTNPSLNPNPLFNFTLVDNENETYFTYNMLNPSMLGRHIIQVDGREKQLTWSESTQEWLLTYVQPPQPCDIYAYCGPFGFCNDNSTTVCVCLQGFKYKSEREWGLNEFSGGCVRNTSLKCGTNYQEEDMDRFIIYPNVRLPRHPKNITAESQADCESTCVKNCSCTAYAYSNSSGHCWIWVGQLLNLKQLGEDDSNGSTIYIRLAAPEFSNIKDTNSKKLLGKLKAIIASVAVAAVALVASTIFWVCYKRRRAALKITELAVDDTLDLTIDKDTDENGIGVPLITFQSILEATNNFSDANKLGEGGFGPVYKGMFLDGQEIAIKRLSSQSRQGIDEFKNEVVLIAKLQHRNLVKLVGYCSQVGEKILLYEYMPNKSLDTFIFDINGQRKSKAWLEAGQEWVSILLEPEQECDVYAYCGPFGICTQTSSPVCACLYGFKQFKSHKQNDYFFEGCVRNTSLKCGTNYQEEGMVDSFKMYPNVRLPRHPQNITTQNQAECESTCLNNCSCTAYAYHNNNGCSLWAGQLLNLKQFDGNNGSTIYIRLAASEFSNLKDTNSKRLLGKLKAIIPSVAVAAAALLACSIFCVCYKRRRASLKITELAVDAIMDATIDEDTDENRIDVPLITFQSILEATNNFSDANKLGEGGFGPVYKAWKLWNEGNAMDLLDDSVLVECCKECEVLKCINVGLLCVEEDPNRRPSMPNVFLMLTDESMNLPKPNQPAFVTRNRICNDSSTVESDKPCSNQLTFSAQEGR